jgi:hypothetical protein
METPPLDALAAIAVHYLLDDKPELVVRAAEPKAFDNEPMSAWVIAQLLHAIPYV